MLRSAYTVLKRLSQSLKPEINGLFCERIFGPTNDFECACGKKPIKFQQFCPICNVEFTSSRVRRYRLGFIKLFNPVVHVWYLKGRPSYLSILLNFSRKQTEALTYCTELILKNIFPTDFNSIFYPHSKNNFFSFKKRTITSEMLISPLKRHFRLSSRFRPDFFILQLINFDFLSIKDYFKRLNKKRFESKKEDKINNTLKAITINNSEKSFNSENININSFLMSDNFWKLSYKRSLNRKGTSNFIHLNYSYDKKFFTHSYYSISKYFCWDNPVKNTHFIYYMTSFPSKKDTKSYYYLKNNSKFNKIGGAPQAGAQIFYHLLKELSHTSRKFNLSALERQIRINLFEMNEFSSLNELFQKVKLLRRLKLVWYFRLTFNKPSWMILSLLPVLPPDLRPIIQLEGNQIAISDLNKLYQKVLFRNNRIQKLKIGHYLNTSEEVQYAQRLLQESVDSLIENGKGGGIPTSALNGRPLKSLSDILKGKQGRFRQNLLGKRVDYSGRSVIVVGPQLQLHECGIPQEMAIELFQPFLIRRLIFEKKARTILGAKQLIQNKDDLVISLLFEIMQNHPILLNRAPTLHRLSIQSFQPRLVGGKAIILHPLVCASFNADFDGDQMAVHVPISYQARSEAWKLLWSQNNLLSPATGQPVLVPSQDMVLGWYFLTAIDQKKFFLDLLNKTKIKISPSTIKQIFKLVKINNFHQLRLYKNTIHIFLDYEKNKINFHTPIWFFWKGYLETDKKRHSTVEVRLDSEGKLNLYSPQFQFVYNWYGFTVTQIICTTAGRVLLNDLIQKKI